MPKRPKARVVELAPNSPLSYIGRGTTYQAKGEFKKAIVDFDRAAELDPQKPGIFLSRASARSENGDVKGALLDFDHAIELSPASSDAYAGRAGLHYRLREWPEAMEDYQRSCDLAHTGHDYEHLFLWLAQARLGQMPEASARLRSFLAARGQAPDNWVSKLARFFWETLPSRNCWWLRNLRMRRKSRSVSQPKKRILQNTIAPPRN